MGPRHCPNACEGDVAKAWGQERQEEHGASTWGMYTHGEQPSQMGVTRAQSPVANHSIAASLRTVSTDRNSL